MRFEKLSLGVVRCGLALSLLAGAAAFASFQPADDGVGASFQVSPSLTVEREKHDFGTIDDSQSQTTTFKFKNSGTGPLNISDVHGSCGCTVPKLAKTVYAPGEGGEITVTFNPHGKKGPVTQTVTITSNDPKAATKQVSIAANVAPMVSVEPQVLQLSQVPKGQGKKQTVTVTGRYPNFAATTITVSDPKVLAAKVLETKPIKAADGSDAFASTVEIELLASASVGQVQQTLTIRTTKEDRVMNVTVLGEVMGEINVQPPRIALGALNLGQDISTTIKLTHREGKNFKITKIEEIPAQGEKVLTLNPVQDDPTKPNSYTLNIGGKAPAAPGSIRGEIQVTTDIESEGVLKLSYFGYARADMPAQPAQPGQPSPGALPAKVEFQKPVAPAAPAPVPAPK